MHFMSKNMSTFLHVFMSKKHVLHVFMSKKHVCMYFMSKKHVYMSSCLKTCLHVLFELRGVDPILMFNLYSVCSKVDQQSIVYTCCGKIIDKLNGVGG